MPACQGAVLERLELLGTGADEGAGHAGPQQPNGARHRPGGRLIVPAGDPIQHPLQEQVIHVSGPPQLFQGL